MGDSVCSMINLDIECCEGRMILGKKCIYFRFSVSLLEISTPIYLDLMHLFSLENNSHVTLKKLMTILDFVNTC